MFRSMYDVPLVMLQFMPDLYEILIVVTELMS